MSESAVFDWNLDYLSRQTPWDTGQPAPELRHLIESRKIRPGRALEMGCGSGSDAMYLAHKGFAVTAVDYSSMALARARVLAAEANIPVELLEADICHFAHFIELVDFVFDRGCYEHLRQTEQDRAGYIATLRQITRGGTVFLLLMRGPASKGSSRTGIQVRRVLAELGEEFQCDEAASADLNRFAESPDHWSLLLTRYAMR